MKTLLSLMFLLLTSCSVQAQIIKLPILVRGAHIFVVAEIGPKHQKAIMLIDSGASQTVLNSKYVPAHKGQIPGDIHIVTVAGIGNVPSLLTALHIEGFDKDSAPLDTVPEILFLNQSFGTADGLLGADVLTQFDRVTFDLKAGVLILEKS
jgi:hypothetical protein